MPNIAYCPQCHLTPSVTHNKLAPTKYTLACKKGCFEMGGNTQKQAVSYWNYVVEWVKKNPATISNPMQSSADKAIFRSLHNLGREEI